MEGHVYSILTLAPLAPHYSTAHRIWRVLSANGYRVDDVGVAEFADCVWYSVVVLFGQSCSTAGALQDELASVCERRRVRLHGGGSRMMIGVRL